MFANNKHKPFNKVKCSVCGSPMVGRLGKYGWFWGCSSFPKCRHALRRSEMEYCPKCYSKMIRNDYSTDYNKCSNRKCDYECRVRWPVRTYDREPYNPYGWSDADWHDYAEFSGIDEGICWGLDS